MTNLRVTCKLCWKKDWLKFDFCMTIIICSVWKHPRSIATIQRDMTSRLSSISLSLSLFYSYFWYSARNFKFERKVRHWTKGFFRWKMLKVRCSFCVFFRFIHLRVCFSTFPNRDKSSVFIIKPRQLLRTYLGLFLSLHNLTLNAIILAKKLLKGSIL